MPEWLQDSPLRALRLKPPLCDTTRSVGIVGLNSWYVWSGWAPGVPRPHPNQKHKEFKAVPGDFGHFGLLNYVSRPEIVYFGRSTRPPPTVKPMGSFAPLLFPIVLRYEGAVLISKINDLRPRSTIEQPKLFLVGPPAFWPSGAVRPLSSLFWTTLGVGRRGGAHQLPLTTHAGAELKSGRNMSTQRSMESPRKKVPHATLTFWPKGLPDDKPPDINGASRRTPSRRTLSQGVKAAPLEGPPREGCTLPLPV